MPGVSLPYGKLPLELLKEILAGLPTKSDEILLGPGIGWIVQSLKPLKSCSS